MTDSRFRGNDTTRVEDDVAGVGDDGRARREWRMRWQGWGNDAQMGLWSGGSAAH